MWRHLYAGIRWLVGADPEPLVWRPVVPHIEPERTIEAIDVDLALEQCVWERARRGGSQCTAAILSIAKINALLEERRSVEMRGLSGVQPSAQPG